MVDFAWVKIWGKTLGAVAWDKDMNNALLEFEESFIDQGLDIAPLAMPLSDQRRGRRIYRFPALNKETFYGLPGLLADALPDRYGNLLIDTWLSRQGRAAGDFSPVERLCYMGKRSMGALEFEPALGKEYEVSDQIRITELVDLAQKVLQQKERLKANLDEESETALKEIIRVGTSAGGARAKAVIALNDQSGEIRSGQTQAPSGYQHWILKFDGVEDIEFGKTQDYGRIEYAYSKMAADARIHMSECRLLEENGRAHFMTRRFDRAGENEKIHMQSLCGMAHFDYNLPGAYSYEQAFQVMRQLRLPYSDAEEMFRRMCFNVVARNMDDHTKNISFLMNKEGNWRLSPAYDVIYSYNPEGAWTSSHQMTINGKRDKIERSDLLQTGKKMNINYPQNIIEDILHIVKQWPRYAEEAGLNEKKASQIMKNLKINI